MGLCIEGYGFMESIVEGTGGLLLFFAQVSGRKQGGITTSSVSRDPRYIYQRVKMELWDS